MAFMDLLRPKWRHSEAEVRLQGVAELSSSEIETLLEIASTDQDEAVRVAAAERIDDPGQLEVLAGRDIPGPVLAIATDRLNQHHVDLVLHGEVEGVRLDALSRIGDEALLVKLATEVKDLPVRLAVIKRIGSEDQLKALLRAKVGREAGLAIVERIDGLDALQEIATSGSNKAVRRAAQSKVEQIQAELDAQDPEKERAAQLGELVQVVEKVQDSWSWDYAEERIAEAEESWPRWDPNRTHELRARFDAALAHFEQRREAFREQREEEERKNAERNRRLTIRRDLCEQLEAAIGSFGEATDAQVAGLQQAWEEAEAVAESLQRELEDRFRTAYEQYRGTAKKLAAEAAEREVLLARFADLAKRADEALGKLESAPGKAWHQIQRIQKQWAQCDDSVGIPADARVRFDAAVAAITQAHQTFVAEQEAKAAASLAEIEAVVTRMEEAAAKAPLASREEMQEIRTAWKLVRRRPEVASEHQARYADANNAFNDKLREKRDEESMERFANLTAKEELIREVEELASETDMPAVAKRIQELQAQWKTIGYVPRKQSDEVWNRFRQVCDEQYQRCKAFFSKQDELRLEARKVKEALCDEAESLADSEEWKATAEIFKDLLERWKQAGSAGRKTDEALYERFNGSASTFFEARRKYYADLEQQRAENLASKKGLLESAQALAESEDWGSTSVALRNLQREWKETGPGPHQEEQPVWEAFHAATQAFFERLEVVRPEHTKARAALVASLAELLLGEPESWNFRELSPKVIDCQKGWREIGPGVRDEEKALYKELRSHCDRFFSERRKWLAHLKEEREQNEANKTDLIFQLEELVGSSEFHAAAESAKQIQAEWKAIGPVPREHEEELTARFRAACDAIFESRNAHFAERHNDRLDALRRREELCVRLEQLARLEGPQDEVKQELSVADQLKAAFEANFVVGSADDESSRWYNAQPEVQRIQAQWKSAGIVPRAQADAIQKRFRRAIDGFYDKRPRSEIQETPEQMKENLANKRLFDSKASVAGMHG